MQVCVLYILRLSCVESKNNYEVGRCEGLLVDHFRKEPRKDVLINEEIVLTIKSNLITYLFLLAITLLIYIRNFFYFYRTTQLSR